MEKLMPVRRALISVFDKTHLVVQARRLLDKGVELVSTGGSRALLEQEGLAVRDVSEFTDFPEIMNGRVKTLHPNIHGGLLALREDETHQQALDQHNIQLFDLLIVNLYPFEATIADPSSDYQACIEKIDIGGPAMIRAAAKNHLYTVVCTDDEDVEAVLEAMETCQGCTPYKLRQHLSAKAFSRTAAYESAISNWFSDQMDASYTPKWVSLAGEVKQKLRYGENPHQTALFCRVNEVQPGVSNAEQIQGKALSYNNINDIDAAFNLISDLPSDQPSVAIIKHANPCGVAVRSNLTDAYRAALACDTLSAFGGIIALNRVIDQKTAELITQIFTEAVIAPDADEAARIVFAKKKNLRLLLTKNLANPEEKSHEFKTVSAGFLLQTRDYKQIKAEDLRSVTKRAPSDTEMEDMLFAWQLVKHVKSNAIVFARDRQVLGIGGGQTSRIDSVHIAGQKALKTIEDNQKPKSYLQGMVCASDAFFPFSDGLIAAAEMGVKAVIQPGGSVKDNDVIKAADQAGLSMVFTDIRHFKH